MEVATTPAYHQRGFPRWISATAMDDDRQLVEDHISGFLASCVTAIKACNEDCKSVESISVIDMDWWPLFSASPHMCEAGWVPAVKAYGFGRAETINNKSMDPSSSVQKKIMNKNGTIVVAAKIDGLLCFEYMPKGNIGKYLSDEYHGLDWQRRINIVMESCKIFKYLHGQLKSRIYHLDLKPRNILLDCNVMPKITDFGLSLCLSTGRNGILKHDGRIVAADKMDMLLCYEHIQNGKLDEYHKLDWSTRLSIVEGICTGLAYLHEQTILHLDIKPAAILLDENWVPKIADFGLSRFSGEQEAPNLIISCTGTLGYMPPEYFNRNIISFKSDIYSFGVILIEMLGRKAGYSKRSEMYPKEFTEIVYENWNNRCMFEPSSKQMKRSNQIDKSCLETGESAKTTSSTIFSTQRVDLDLIRDVTFVLYTASLSMVLLLHFGGCALAAALSMHQHLYRSNLTDERSGKPRSNRAPEPNSPEGTTMRAPMANKLTEDEAENHSDPNSCVVERDTNEKEKRSAEWYIATGAAHHATWKRDLFSNLVDVENDGRCVHAADGTPMPVCGRGDVVTDDVVLPDVYYVPGLCTNLVSVGQLAGLDYCVGFGRGACTISNAAGTVVGRAHARGDGLYEVDFLRVPLSMP